MFIKIAYTALVKVKRHYSDNKSKVNCFKNVDFERSFFNLCSRTMIKCMQTELHFLFVCAWLTSKW